MNTLPKEFQLVETGGGCTAWQRTHADGSCIVVTDSDGASANWNINDVLICAYDTNGDYVRDIDLVEFLESNEPAVVQQ